jgi:hypothetical protein
MAGILQSEVPPGPAAIIGAPDTAQPLAHIAAHGALAFPGIDDIVVGRGHADGTDAAAEIFVGHIGPVAAAIDRLPDPAPGAAEIEYLAVLGAAGHRSTAASPEGTHEPEFQLGLQERIRIRNGGNGRSGLPLGGHRQGKEQCDENGQWMSHVPGLNRQYTKHRSSIEFNEGQKKIPSKGRDQNVFKTSRVNIQSLGQRLCRSVCFMVSSLGSRH